jgi:hypothetical protein
VRELNNARTYTAMPPHRAGGVPAWRSRHAAAPRRAAWACALLAVGLLSASAAAFECGGLAFDLERFRRVAGWRLSSAHQLPAGCTPLSPTLAECCQFAADLANFTASGGPAAGGVGACVAASPERLAAAVCVAHERCMAFSYSNTTGTRLYGRRAAVARAGLGGQKGRAPRA